MYEIAAFKSFKGHEGEPCAQGNLVKDGKKVAFWSDDSHGGPLRVDFISKTAESEFLVFAKQFLSTRKDFENKPYDLDGNAWHLIENTVQDMSTEYEQSKALEKAAKKGLCFKVIRDGKEVCLVSKSAYTASNVAQIKAQYGDALKEIVNETLGFTLVSDEDAKTKADFERYKKACKTKFYFSLKDESGAVKVMYLNRAYSPELAKAYRDKHPNLVEILNERYL